MDIDFSVVRPRPRHQLLAEKYGRKRVAQIITYVVFQHESSGVRNALRSRSASSPATR